MKIFDPTVPEITPFLFPSKKKKIYPPIIPPGTLMVFQTLWTPTDSTQMKMFALKVPDQDGAAIV